MLKLFLPVLLLLTALPLPRATALDIEQAVDHALASHEQVRAAEQDAQAAAARIGRARAMLLPALTAEADWTRHGSGVTSGDEGVEGRLLLNQTLFSARAFPLVGQALKTRDAALAQVLETRRTLAYRTASAFLDALTEQQVAQAAAHRRELALQALAEIRVRFDAQLTGSNDVTRAELEAATAEREHVRRSGSAHVARLALENLVGMAADSLEVPAALLTRAAGPTGQAEADRTLETRSDILVARLRVDALRRSALEPLMRWVPDVGVSGSTRAEPGEGLDTAQDNWTVSLGARWPLFDGGGREADRAERLALARSAEWQLAGLERGVALELASTHAQLESARSSRERASVALEAARRNAVESAELYRRGLVRALDVLDANVQWFEAEAEHVRAGSELAAAFLDYRQAQGLDPFDKELQR
jgi:outer membrane protein